MKYFFIFNLMWALLANAQENYTVSGYVKEKGSGESVIGAIVYAPQNDIATETNSYGFYSITLPEGDSLVLRISGDAYTSKDTVISLRSNVLMNVSIDLESITELKEVVITSKESKISKDVEMSKIEIPISTIKNIPALLGEKDVLKVIQLLPGVKRGKEGTMGFYVRGGGPDQNLIILDDAVVYNAQHLFGFFSVFNGDAIRNIELSKGGFPARYGGRLSSVLDIKMKEGHKEKLQGEAGIGILSSRLTLEGPIKKGKSSFLISGRRTYFDLLTKPFQPKYTKFGYYFYDFNTKINFVLSPKDKLFISSYLGRDIFYFNLKESDGSYTKTGLAWGNTTSTVRWNHIFTPKLFGNTAFIFSNYKFVTGAEFKGKYESAEFKYSSKITDFAIKMDYDFNPSTKHHVRFGTQNTLHLFQPTGFKIQNSQSNSDNLDKKYNINAIDANIFVEDVYAPSVRWKINPGVRLTAFRLADVTYKNAEPRLAVAYLMNKDFTLKGSYATMNQYIHLLTNSGIGLPTDLWIPSTQIVKPQTSRQIALGLAKDLTKVNLQFSVEGYYKKMFNTVSYKEGKGFFDTGTSLLSNTEDWQNFVTQGLGTSYGVELLLQRKYGKLNGWIGYTLSWAKQQFKDVNNGKEFYARYDSRNDVSVVMVYEIKKNLTISGTWVYNTGYPINPPVSEYVTLPQADLLNNYRLKTNNQSVSSYLSSRNEYLPRNSVRMQAYHRFDIGLQFSKEKKNYTRTFELSFYNAYNRKNPFMYIIDYEGSSNGNGLYTQKSELQKVTIFPIIPSVSWGFKF